MCKKIILLLILCISHIIYAQPNSMFMQAEEDFNKGNYNEAMEKYLQIKDNPFANSRELGLSKCKIGIIYSFKDKLEESRNNLQESIEKYELPSKNFSVCSYALLQVYFLLNEDEEAKKLIPKMQKIDLPATYISKIYALFSEIGNRTGDKKTEIMALGKLKDAMNKSQVFVVEMKILGNKKYMLSELSPRINILSKQVKLDEQEESEKIEREKQKALNQEKKDKEILNSSIQDRKNLDISEKKSHETEVVKLLEKDSKEVVTPNLEKLMSPTPASPNINTDKFDFLFPQLSKSLINKELYDSRINKINALNPKTMRIGVIVPVGISFTRINNRILRGISSFLNSSATKGVEFSFFIEPVLGDVASIEEAAIELILKQHVQVLIGPYTNSQALGLVQVANLFEVPAFAFGPVIAAPELESPYLIRMGILARSQSSALIDYLKDDPAYQSSAVFSPADAYGVSMAKAFTDVALEKNYVLQGSSYYPIGKDLYQEEVAKIAADAKYDEEEYKKALENEQKKAELKKAKVDMNAIKVKKKLPFEVLFVPDVFSKVKIISSTFAFQEIKTPLYIGDSQWNGSVGQVSIADQFLNGSKFPELVKGQFAHHLLTDLKIDFNQVDLERQVFDSLIFVRQAQYVVGGNKPDKINAAIHSADWKINGVGIYGSLSSNGEPFAKYKIVEYRNGHIVD